MDYTHLRNDISYRMIMRTIYLYCFIFNLIIQYYISQIYLLDINTNFNLVHTYNYYLIYFINTSHLVYIILTITNISNFINQSFISSIVFIIQLTDIILKCIGSIINSSVMIEPEFQFITFYVWNLCIILNICLSLLFNKLDSIQIKPSLPGKSVKIMEDCSICLQNNTNWKLPCNHTFHYDCINKWFLCNRTCPYCRCKFT